MKRLVWVGLLVFALGLSPHAARAAVANPCVERVDKDHIVVSWEDSAPVSVYMSDRNDATVAQSALVIRDNKDGRYMVAASSHKHSYFLLRDSTGDVRRAAERLLPLDQGSNFRDIGGYVAADGRHVRWGLIYRSGATPMLSDRDVAYIHGLGLYSMIDLRSTEERKMAPSRLVNQGIQYIAIDYSFNDISGTYESLLTALTPQYREIFRQLLSKKGSISYNCTAGQDRTGVATALILSALGVPRQTILNDYHLSTRDREPLNEMPAVDPQQYPGNPAAALFAKARLMPPPPLYSSDGRSYLAILFDRIDARWGSVETYLQQSLGVGPAELAQLRSQYLE